MKPWSSPSDLMWSSPLLGTRRCWGCRARIHWHLSRGRIEHSSISIGRWEELLPLGSCIALQGLELLLGNLGQSVGKGLVSKMASEHNRNSMISKKFQSGSFHNIIKCQLLVLLLLLLEIRVPTQKWASWPLPAQQSFGSISHGTCATTTPQHLLYTWI